MLHGLQGRGIMEGVYILEGSLSLVTTVKIIATIEITINHNILSCMGLVAVINQRIINKIRTVNNFKVALLSFSIFYPPKKNYSLIQYF